MQMAITQQYPRALARYEFVNRGRTIFPDDFSTKLQEQVDMMSGLELTEEEKQFLLDKCGLFLTPPYIDMLKSYRFDPREVKIIQNDEELNIVIEGPWYRTVLWEVPLMSLISELYFIYSTNPEIKENPLSPQEVKNRAANKAERFAEAQILFADFGSRRRKSFRVHSEVVEQLVQHGGEYFVGTSNVYLAMLNNIKPIGTQAHEWISFHGAKYGFRMANHMAMKVWSDTYKGNLGIVLTDTFTTKDFWRSFDTFYAKLYDGVRHDSADPFEFGEEAIEHYKSLGIDPMTKTIVFSDGLVTDQALKIAEHFKNRIKISFGIGTHFTNDTGYKPLNIVIKMFAAKPEGFKDWVPVIKLSDVSGKHTGDQKTIELCKQLIGV